MLAHGYVTAHVYHKICKLSATFSIKMGAILLLYWFMYFKRSDISTCVPSGVLLSSMHMAMGEVGSVALRLALRFNLKPKTKLLKRNYMKSNDPQK